MCLMLCKEAAEPKNDMKFMNIFNRKNGFLSTKDGSKHAWQFLCAQTRRHS